MHRSTAAAALAVTAATLLAACGGSSSTTTAETTTTAAPATTAETTTATPPATTTTAAATPKRITIVIRNGKILGGGPAEATVDKGTRVVLKVTADVSDEVHLHGYDLHAGVAPGSPARIAFTASIAGRFEAELESRSFTILHLTVE